MAVENITVSGAGAIDTSQALTLLAAVSVGKGRSQWQDSPTYSTFSFPNSAGSGFLPFSGYTISQGWGTPPAPPVPPSPPTLLSPTPITFRWGASTGATNYYLQVNPASDFSSTFVWDGEVGNVTSQEVLGLNLGTNYYWHVKACNDAGCSDWSAVRSTRIDEVPLP